MAPLFRFSTLAASLLHPCCDPDIETITIQTTALQPIYSEQLKRRRVFRMPPTTRRASRAQARASAEASTPPVQAPSPILQVPSPMLQAPSPMLHPPPTNIDREDVRMVEVEAEAESYTPPIPDTPSPRTLSIFPPLPDSDDNELQEDADQHKFDDDDDDHHLEYQITEAIYRQSSIHDAPTDPDAQHSSSSGTSDEDEDEDEAEAEKRRAATEAKYTSEYIDAVKEDSDDDEGDVDSDIDDTQQDETTDPRTKSPELDFSSGPIPTSTSQASPPPCIEAQRLDLMTRNDTQTQPTNTALPLTRTLPPEEDRPFISYVCGNVAPETKWAEDVYGRRFIGWIRGCEEVSRIRAGEPMRCKYCGGRALYKMRTRRMVQFETN